MDIIEQSYLKAYYLMHVRDKMHQFDFICTAFNCSSSIWIGTTIHQSRMISNNSNNNSDSFLRVVQRSQPKVKNGRDPHARCRSVVAISIRWQRPRPSTPTLMVNGTDASRTAGRRSATSNPTER